MRLQKQSSRKKEDPNYEKYVKWVLVISGEKVKQLGWGEGTELKDEIKGDTLKITPLSSKEIIRKKEEVTYPEFRDSIRNILERHPKGITWSQIKDKLNYSQKAPNNKWVRKLEKDILLKRIKRGGTMVWKLEYDTIYSIGYEGLDIDKFVKKLKDSNVQQLIDVREIALSRKNGFSKGILGSVLKEVGIRYKHVSSLGSPRDLRHQLKKDWDYKKFFSEYSKHIKDEDVQESITEVEGLSKMKKTVLLCFERDHKTCHRSIITNELKRRGWKISHL